MSTMTRNRIAPTLPPAVPRPLSLMPHPQAYQVCCSNCRAITAHDVETDCMRMLCPACARLLTIPAKLLNTCEHCGDVTEYRHILAGHSCSCGSCGEPVLLPAIVARAKVHRRPHRARRRRRFHSRCTPAFSDTAERSMILAVATIATIIFVIVFSLM